MDQNTFNSLPVAQRKALQQQLKDQGLYGGTPDGQWGPGTSAAFKQQDEKTAADAERTRSDALKEKELDIRATDAKAKAATAASGAKTTDLKNKALEKYQEQESSPLGIGTKIAAGPVALSAGKAIGLGIGHGVNEYMNEGQRQSNETLRGAAQDRVKGLTTREGAVTGTRLAGAMPFRNPLLRTMSRLAPNAGLGGVFLGTGAELLGDYDPNQSFYPRMADRAFGLGSIGAGTGLLTQGITHAARPKVSPDAQALAVINSNQLRRNNQSASPEIEKAMTPRQQLVEQAKAAGIKNTARMNMTSLGEALSQVKKLPPGPAGAAIAAAMAYAATPNRAEASEDGSVGADRSEALTNAGVAGGAAIAAQHYLPKAMKFIAERSGPVMLSDMAGELGRYAYDHGYMQPPMQKATEAGGGAAGAAAAPNEPSPGNPAYPLSGPMPNAEAIPVPYPDLVSAMGRSAPAQSPPPSPAATMQIRRLVEAMMQGR